MTVLPFIGRDKSLKKLRELLNRRTSSLVVVKGRRRIGKSRLVEEFAKDCRFLEFAGIAPVEGVTEQTQRDVFASRLGHYLGFPSIKSNDWSDLFQMLADRVKTGRVIILLDEISWMAMNDETFLGKLKNIWDMELKKNSELILVLCSSVSVWVEKNIISSTGYFGRIVKKISLEELPLNSCNQILAAQHFIGSDYEKFQLLSITGGVPWYLELLQPGLNASQNIKELCFTSDGNLVEEFNMIFHDLFDTRSEIYKKIVTALVDGSKSHIELQKILKYNSKSTLVDYLKELELSRFITRDYTWSLHNGKYARLSKYRLSDNYLRYYLKFIEPNLVSIQRGYYEHQSLMGLPSWVSTMALQFENLVLKNRMRLFDILGINPADIVCDNPFFQRKTIRQRGCQIDYMIQTKLNTLIVFELKFSIRELPFSIIQEVQQKLDRITKPRGFSCFPALIHVNGVDESVIDSGFFYRIIDFSELLNG
ncbi:MAG: AAA family ATPase [Gammaproteobacteria bacterium]